MFGDWRKDLGAWQVGGIVADLLAIIALFVAGEDELALTAIALTVSVATVIWFCKRLPAKMLKFLAKPFAVLLAVTLLSGGVGGYLWGPSVIPTKSRDVDVWGYCGALGSSGASVENPRVPREPEGQFFCDGVTKPVDLNLACRWKWGPQRKPPTLADETNSYTWRCHPRYR